jgi:hypothetical protein
MNRMQCRSIPYLNFCKPLLIILLGFTAMAKPAFAQSEAESANTLALQRPNSTAHVSIPKGAQLKVYMKPGENAGYQEGEMTQVTDSTIVVAGEVLPLQEVESITYQRLAQKKQSFVWMAIGAVLQVLSILGWVYWIPAIWSIWDAILVGLLVGTVGSVGFGVLVMGIILLATFSSHYVMKRYQYRAVHRKPARKKSDQVPRIR